MSFYDVFFHADSRPLQDWVEAAAGRGGEGRQHRPYGAQQGRHHRPQGPQQRVGSSLKWFSQLDGIHQQKDAK